MKIDSEEGKYGKGDRIILITTTGKDGALKEREPISIFKVAVIVNQITFNELNMKEGFKKRLVKQGQELFVEEAIKEAIEMAKDDINWGETHNRVKVIEWAERWGLDPEEIELELRRTFQKGLEEFSEEK